MMSAAKWIAAFVALPMAVCQAASSSTVVFGSLTATLAAVSGAFAGSSQSSADAMKNAQGEYRVIDVAEAVGRPDWMRVELAPENKDGRALYLYLTRAEWRQGAVGIGQLVAARARPYGLSFTKQGGKETFAVVLSPAWLNDIGTKAVTS